MAIKSCSNVPEQLPQPLQMQGHKGPRGANFETLVCASRILASTSKKEMPPNLAPPLEASDVNIYILQADHFACNILKFPERRRRGLAPYTAMVAP